MTETYVLTIAGSDPSGGAGIQADLETFAAFKVAGLSAITAITAQNAFEVTAIHPTPSDILTQQISAACSNKNVEVLKIGMIATLTNVKTIAWFLHHTKFKEIVIDPVLHASSGAPLLETKALAAFRQQLLPLATVITPNLQEAGVLAGMQVSKEDTMKEAAKVIYNDTIKLRGGVTKPLAIIVKGGHLTGDAVDIMFDGKDFFPFTTKRVSAPPRRGTGCRFSAAIAACLANGDDLKLAIEKAKKYLVDYISAGK